MVKEDIKEEIDELRQKMALIEWDRKHSRTFGKEHIYNELKKKYQELTEKDKLKKKTR